ncbi:hypothetical protein G4Y79_01780 [Phototrophicus methaneseepsis]|uniref:Uncharacterized protein n=1 Tax=Phototrophicus methaneseepsis TaxID=2710758 RepID=A0A7S8IDZ8_9CHLR|nr:hypothetical protein [Phototrophicus methaneseepsis]QPC83130.1 hypothetical protein G4Y79_01780 [Phototrophicus methaneseepsis]
MGDCLLPPVGLGVEFTHQLHRMTNRLALTILLAATIVALGLVMTIYYPPSWEQYAG